MSDEEYYADGDHFMGILVSCLSGSAIMVFITMLMCGVLISY